MYKRRVGFLISFIALVICVIAVLFVNRSFVHEETAQKPEVGSEQSAVFKNGYIEVNSDVIGVDPATDRLTVELDFVPHGRFDAGGGALATELEVDVNDISSDNSTISFAVNKRMAPREAVIDMSTGEAADYPFDKYGASLQVLVLEKNNSGGFVNAPATLDFTGDYHGYVFNGASLPADSHGYLGFNIQLARSPLVFWTAIFCLAIMWGLTFVNLFLLWSVLRKQMEVDLGLFGYMSGFIVAMYFFRQILPDVPSFIGVFADYLAFFWVELIAAVISTIFAMVWFRTLVKETKPKK